MRRLSSCMEVSIHLSHNCSLMRHKFLCTWWCIGGIYALNVLYIGNVWALYRLPARNFCPSRCCILNRAMVTGRYDLWLCPESSCWPLKHVNVKKSIELERRFDCRIWTSSRGPHQKSFLRNCQCKGDLLVTSWLPICTPEQFQRTIFTDSIAHFGIDPQAHHCEIVVKCEASKQGVGVQAYAIQHEQDLCSSLIVSAEVMDRHQLYKRATLPNEKAVGAGLDWRYNDACVTPLWKASQSCHLFHSPRSTADLASHHKLALQVCTIAVVDWILPVSWWLKLV